MRTFYISHSSWLPEKNWFMVHEDGDNADNDHDVMTMVTAAAVMTIIILD